MTTKLQRSLAAAGAAVLLGTLATVGALGAVHADSADPSDPGGSHVGSPGILSGN
jgi:hypothetical protein